jgi:hypothetical protein
MGYKKGKSQQQSKNPNDSIEFHIFPPPLIVI